MHIECEARALEIDKEEIERKLVSLGAKKIADFDYKRRVYDVIPKTEGKWIRLRTDGNKTTLAVKQINKETIDGTEETEVEVSDFEETNKILNSLGFFEKGYQENKRTRYVLNGIELDIDTWPYIPTYLEIEGKDSKDVEKMIELLEIDKSKVTTLGVLAIFEQVYKIDAGKIPVSKFDIPLDDKYKIRD